MHDLKNGYFYAFDQFDQLIKNPYAHKWCSIQKNIFGISGLRSRHGEFSTPWDYATHPGFVTPELKFIHDRHDDLYDQRALEIAAENKPIYVMWSGGIDSTCVLSSFFRNLAAADLKRITVVLNFESILENPDFYKKFIRPNCSCMSIYDLEVNNDFLSQNILLHGDPGDALYGPSISMFKNLIPTKQYQLPWKDNLELLKSGIPGDADFVDWYVNKISHNLFETNPANIDTIGDWWWWHYYNFKWEFSIWRPLVKCRKDISTGITQENIFNYLKNTFYNNEKFQQWSYSHHDTHIENHKLSAKKYIFDLNHDQNYFDRKIKVASNFQKNISPIKILPLYFDQNWQGHYPTNQALKKSLSGILDCYQG